MDFYQTKMGKGFYERTVPRIAKALEDIAKSLSVPAPVVQLPQDIPEDFLTDLYLGNYDPSGEPLRSSRTRPRSTRPFLRTFGA